MQNVPNMLKNKTRDALTDQNCLITNTKGWSQDAFQKTKEKERKVVQLGKQALK